MTLRAGRAKKILGRFSRQRILVVGDLMLDRYIYGGVSRISPEAPVPIVHVTHEKSMPGGASNVAWNVQSLGGRAAVCGVLGKDANGRELKDDPEARRRFAPTARWKSKGFARSSRRASSRSASRWSAWTGRTTFDLAGRTADDFCRRLASEVKKSTGVIIEDYGKGVIRQSVVDTVLKTAKASGIPVGLDPKENHELGLGGITVATPNRKEAFTIAGVKESPAHSNPLEDKMLLKVADILMKKWSPALLLITLGPLGILLVTKNAPPKHVPTRAREVFDVSGAGDTVIATCVLALAAGASQFEAAELANYAAGVVVGKLGTATCTQQELLKLHGLMGYQ